MCKRHDFAPAVQALLACSWAKSARPCKVPQSWASRAACAWPAASGALLTDACAGLVLHLQAAAQVRRTAQILGNNECFEPYTSNIYVRRVLSGEFTVVNQHLLMDLTRLGLWDPELKNELVAANGSVQVSVVNPTRSWCLPGLRWPVAVLASGRPDFTPLLALELI